MFVSALKTTTNRLVRGTSRLRIAPKTVLSTTRQISTDQEKIFQEQGILDKDGLTVFETLHDMQVRACTVYAENQLFGTFSPSTESFEYISYKDYNDRVDRCRAVLRDLGVEEFGKVAIIANNRWEWATIAAAAYSLRASLVPMYEAQLASDWTYILNDSGSSVVFCATQDIYDRVQKEVLPSTPSVKAALCLDAPEGAPHAFATAMSASDIDEDGKLVLPPTGDDLANLIYTSGTTGKPKGVELTHENVSTNIVAASRSLVTDPTELISENDTSLAFLPWAHSYGQTCELWMGISGGARIGICRGVPWILEDLQLVKPTILFAVPALYQKVYDGIRNVIQGDNHIRSAMLRHALSIGRSNVQAMEGKRELLGPLEQLKFKVLDNLVLSKIRDRFGGNLRCGCVAGAACPSEVLNFMDSIGIPICEGYGLTETSPIITINVPSQRSVGSVGRAIGDVTVHIIDQEGNPVPPGEEGEICCVGPNVMKGYHNNPEATDEVISLSPDGSSRMFHTGDLGRMDEDGWLRVTGRLKEQYKLENGKYVVPTPIETAVGMSRFISQVVLCGANRPFNVALIVPEWAAIRTELKIDATVSEEDLANDTKVHALIDSEIEQNCKNLKKFEVPVKWAFVAPFTAANNMLTPKMSIRRHKVIAAYEDEISHLYGVEPMHCVNIDSREEKAVA